MGLVQQLMSCWDTQQRFMRVIHDDFHAVFPRKWKEMFSFQSNWHPLLSWILHCNLIKLWPAERADPLVAENPLGVEKELFQVQC